MAKLSALQYDPNQSFDVQVSDVEYRHDGTTSWQATIYQPQGSGPFPALLDVHGGAWNRGARGDNELMNRALAASGMVVAAVDYRLAPQHPYPAQVEDVIYATRWLKFHAADFNARPDSVGALGASSGGHTVMLSALRPADPRYRSLALPGGDDVDATLLYVIGAWPVLDPYVRYHYAREAGNQRLAESSEAYFLTEDAMREANPQQILDRREEVQLPPTLIIQGTSDDNVPMSIPNNFVQAYRAAGGSIDLEVFPDQPHGFGNRPGVHSQRALEMMKAFVARQLARTAAAV
jgi:acetyl esterase